MSQGVKHEMKGLIGRKVGMTRLFVNGVSVPVTVIKAGPCVVVQKKTIETDGYNAIQLGFEEVPERKVNKPMLGHFSRAKVKPHRILKELRVDNPDEYPEADVKAAKYLLGILKKEGEIVTRDDLEKERQIDKIESDMKAAAKKFGRIKELPKFDEGEIIQHMQETGIRNPEKAYKDLYEDEWFDYKVKQAKKSKSYMTEKRGEKIQKNKKEYKEGEEGDREYLLDEIRKIKT